MDTDFEKRITVNEISLDPLYENNPLNLKGDLGGIL